MADLYRRVEGSRGTRYTLVRGGKAKFIGRDKIPEHILMKLDKTSEVKFSGCIFCGEEATKQRLVEEVMVDLCDEHYYSQTIGRIVAKLRERITNGVQQVTSS